MLQIIVCEVPIPSRLLLKPPLHTYCGTCMEIRFVTHVTGNLGGLPYYSNSPFTLSMGELAGVGVDAPPSCKRSGCW
jgi:hypothetical protein